MNLGWGQIDNVRKPIPDETPPDETPPDEPEIHKEPKRWKAVGRNIVESNYYELAVILLTFVALFTDDAESLILTSQTYRTDEFG